MKELSFNELLEYYSGFSFETGIEKIWNNLPINDSKEMALCEINNRCEKFRDMNDVYTKIADLEITKHHLELTLRNPSEIFVVDTGIYSETYNFVKSLSDQSDKLHNPKIKLIISELKEKIDELEQIWKTDPEHLRYQSKFPQGTYPNQYINGSFEINNWISSRNRDFKVHISENRLDYDFVNSIARKSSKYEVVIYPIFRNKGDGEINIINFLFNLLATNQKNIKLIICWIEDADNKDFEMNGLYQSKNELKIEIIKNRFIGFKVDYINFVISQKSNSYDKLIEKI